MATKVIDLDLKHLPQTIDNLHDYRQALVLYRHRGVPVAQAWLPIVNGRLNRIELHDAAVHNAIAPLWLARLQETKQDASLPAATASFLQLLDTECGICSEQER